MILTDNEILKRISCDEIIIHPYETKRLNSSGYDLTLGRNMMFMHDSRVDLKDLSDVQYNSFTMDSEGMWLLPGVLYLGVSNEYTSATQRDLMMMYEGKSSLGRLGFESHICAGAGDVGFRGHWTLEIRVMQQTKIYPGMPIGQIMFYETKGEVINPYSHVGKYANDFNKDPWPTISKYDQNFSK